MQDLLETSTYLTRLRAALLDENLPLEIELQEGGKVLVVREVECKI